MELIDTLFQIAASSMRLAVPLLLACLAGLWSERAGVVDIGLEGKMLAAAFAAAVVAIYTGNAFMGLFAGILCSILFSLVHGYASISQRGNQIVSGVAINMLAAGLAAVLGNAWYQQGGRTPPVESVARFLPINLPGADVIGAIPVIGGFFLAITSSLGWRSSPSASRGGRFTAHGSGCGSGLSAKILRRSIPPASPSRICATCPSSSAVCCAGLAARICPSARARAISTT
jgi:Branched-chain amino acid transport system / permease component